MNESILQSTPAPAGAVQQSFVEVANESVGTLSTHQPQDGTGPAPSGTGVNKVLKLTTGIRVVVSRSAGQWRHFGINE